MKISSSFIAIILIIVTVFGGLSIYYLMRGETDSLRVFHAGSLARPFGQLEQRFENHYEYDVQRESHGSVEAVKQVTELNKPGDVIGVADYSLIPKMMVPDYAEWYVCFARNEMVLSYTDDSDYSDEINENNWYEILSRSDVRFGFSNPNLDPCGYRSPMVIQFAENYYDNSNIFDTLIEANSEIRSNRENGKYLIEVPKTGEIKPDSEKIKIAPKEIDLITDLKNGSSLDYAFEYRSVAVQQGLKKLELPDWINLSNTEHENFYSTVRIKSGGDWHVGKPIVYGVTVSKNSQNLAGGVSFVKFLLGEEGRRIFRDCGQQPIVPPIVVGGDNLPKELRDLVN